MLENLPVQLVALPVIFANQDQYQIQQGCQFAAIANLASSTHCCRPRHANRVPQVTPHKTLANLNVMLVRLDGSQTQPQVLCVPHVPLASSEPT